MRVIVLHTLWGIPPGGGVGGGTLHHVALSNKWAQMGAEAIWLVGDQGDGIRNLLTGARVVVIPAVPGSAIAGSIQNISGMIFNHFLQRSRLRSFASQCHPARETRVVATSAYLPDALGALQLGRLLSSPVVLYFHHLARPPWWHPFKRGGLIRVTGNWLMNTAVLYMAKVSGSAISLDQPRELGDLGWRPWREVLQDDDFVEQPRSPVTQSLEFRRTDACFIGGIAKRKGVFDLIRAWELVVQAHPSARLVIAGKPESNRTLAAMTRLISQRGLDGKVVLLGYMGEAEKLSLLDSTKVFLYPSYEEGWSLAVMEAAMHGAVPVTYDLPAYDYLGPAAIKVPVGDVRALADSASSLLASGDSRIVTSEALLGAVAPYNLEAVAATQLERIGALTRSPSAARAYRGGQ